jgi:xanthine dehydrogenase accessory factor
MVDIYEKLSEFKKDGKDAVIITVTSKEGMGPCDVGKKLIVSSSGEFFGTIGGGAIEHFAIDRAKSLLIERKSLSEKYVLNDKPLSVDRGDVKLDMACGGTATLFYEFVGPKQFVYIFGGGHCGSALARLLKPLGFYTVIIDNRKEIIDGLDDSANEKVCQGFVDYINEHKVLDNRYVVVCTPSHISDYDVLDRIIELKMKPKYFGMLCSKKKVSDYLEKVYEKHSKDVDLSNFYSPIGLPTGGDSPEEVAISIASEILSIYYDKDEINAHMRDVVKRP